MNHGVPYMFGKQCSDILLASLSKHFTSILRYPRATVNRSKYNLRILQRRRFQIMYFELWIRRPVSKLTILQPNYTRISSSQKIFPISTAFNPTIAQSTTIIRHFTICLLQVSASTWPFSGRSPTKEQSNDRFYYRYPYVE